MESARTRGHLIVFIALFATTVLLPVSVSAAAVGPKCQDGEFLTDDNICCTKCFPGTKLTQNCRSHEHKTNCTRCPAEQYMDQINYSRNCFRCTRCKESHLEIEESPCTPKKDRKCRCKDGYYKSFIDTRKFECLKCSACGKNETEAKPCSQDGDTECRCKDNYYRAKNKCLLCTNCTAHPECSAFCPQLTHKDPVDTLPSLTNVIVGSAVVVVQVLLVVICVTHFVTKRQTKKKLQSSSQSTESPKTYEELTTHFEEPLVHSLVLAPPHTAVSQEPSNLPDCVPLEIKIPDVIYTLLDFVPVLRVKQLARSLGVSDAVIERAELDFRSSREAHYQMLRVWAEQGGPACRGGGGGQSGVLHLPLLHQLLDKLRLMHLEQTAQELETKYGLL